MKKKFINGLLLVAVLFGATSAMISCKDYDDDYRYTLQAGLDNEASLREALEAQVNNMATLLAQLQLQQKACRTHCDSMFLVIQNDYLLKTDAAATYLTIGDANTFYLKISDAAATYLTQVEAALKYLTKDDAGNIYLKITEADLKYYSKTDADNKFLTKEMATTLLSGYYDKATIDGFKADLLTKIGDLQTADATLQGAIDALKAQLVTSIAALNKTDSLQQNSISTLTGQLNEAIATLGSVKTKAENAYDLAQNALTNSVTALNIANRADSIADKAILDAATAKLTAENAQKYAEQVKADADKGIAEAKAQAAKAQETADSARIAAELAKEFATAAKVTAGEAKELAQSAYNMAVKHEALIEGLTTTTERLDTDIKTLEAKVDQQKKDLEEAIQNQGKRLEEMIVKMFNHADSVAHAALEKAIANEKGVAANAKNIEDLKTLMTTNLSELKTDMQTMKGELQTYVDNQIATVKSELSQDITDLRNDVVTAMNGLQNYIDNKDQILQNNIDNLGSAMTTADQTLQTNIDNLETQLLSKLADLATTMNTADGVLQTNIDNLKTDLTKYVDDAVSNLQTILNTEVTNLKDNMKSLNQTVQTLQSDFNDLVALWGPQLGEALTKANDAYEAAKYAHIRIDSLGKYCLFLRELIAANKDEINDVKLYSILGDVMLNNKIDSLDRALTQALKDSVVALHKEAARLYQEALKYTDEAKAEALKALVDSCSDIRTDMDANIAKLKKAYEDADKVLEGKIQTLDGKVNTLTTVVNTLKSEITKKLDQSTYDKFVKEYDEFKKTLQTNMAKMITSITINGTYNPVYGTFNIPVSLRSNVLVAYHGYIEDKGVTMTFPTRRPAFFKDPTNPDIITDEDWAFIKGDAETITTGVDIVAKDGAKGNAGKLYLTVNPANEDFTGVEPMLVNSTNYVSGVELSPIRKSTDKLSFGWSRANETGNGFYEADATLPVSALYGSNTRLRLDLASIKEVAQDLKTWKDRVSVTNLATAIYTNINDVLDASAVKVQYKDEATGVQRALTSDYELAATAIKPLGYNTMKDIKYNNQLLKVETFIDKLIKKVEDKLEPYINKVNGRITNIGNFVKNITLYDVEADPDHIIAHMVIEVDGKAFINPDGSSKYIEGYSQDVQLYGDDVMVHIYYDVRDDVKQLYESVADQLDDVKDLVDDYVKLANDYLADVNALYDKIEDLIGIDRIYTYIEKLNTRLNRWLNPNKYMQPLMLAQTKDGYRRASLTKSAPSKIADTEFKLWPTTYNLEVLTPAYKKYVVCTKAYDSLGNESTSARDAFNSSSDYLKKVQFGEWKSIDVKIQKGYTYEVLYMSMDFHGCVVAKKNYFVGI